MANKYAVGILAIDPGATTGCAAGVFDTRQETVLAAMRRAWIKGHLVSWEVGGNHVEQAWEIARWFTDWQFRMHVERGWIAHGRFYVVLEDFIPAQLNFNPISLLVIGGIEALLSPKQAELGFSGMRAQPHQRWKDDAWLKSHGLWVSSPHERDARRHVAGVLDTLV